MALEGALKFKEITYEHAEGFAASELKHGPLALVTPNTPVFAIFSGKHDEKTVSNVEEVRTRGAPVIGVASERSTRISDAVDEFVPVPTPTRTLRGYSRTSSSNSSRITSPTSWIVRSTNLGISPRA